MLESKNMLENKILKLLSIHNAMGQNLLFEKVSEGDDPEYYINYQVALNVLVNKGIIDIVTDKADTMNVVRLVQVLH